MMLSLLCWIPPTLASTPESEWWMYRPSEHAYINHHVENASTNDEASVGIGVFIASYEENANFWPFEPGRDGLIFRVAATANTRKGITYNHYTVDSLIHWIDLSSLGPEYIVTTHDDGGRWISLPASLAVRFYGGPGGHPSAEYEKVWVCSNGFLSFDSESNSSDPKSIPNSDNPNTLLAVYWSDLDPTGGWIKYYIDETHGLFIVEWYNVLNKNNGIRQTFEVIIWNSWDSLLRQRGQNEFAFLYQSVTWDDCAVAGIEDQEGYKGIQTGGLSGQSVYFNVEKEAAEIRWLKIRIEKCDGEAEIWIARHPGVLKGVNLQSRDEDPAPPWYEDAVCDGVTLLMSSILSAALGPAAGVIFKASLIGFGAVAAYVQEFSPFKYEDPDVKDADTTENEAHLHAKAEGSWGWPVDASFGSQIYWVFTDDSTRDHSIEITATLEYCYYNTNHEIFTDEISTSVDLSVKIGRTLTISTSSGGTTFPTPGTYTYDYGESVTVNASSYSNYAFDYWILDGATKYGKSITVTMNSDHNLKAYFKHTGGGGCPFVHPWNGTGYAIDNNLLGDSEASGGADVEDYYRLEQPLIRKDGKYALLIKEFEQEHSYLDQVGLLAVDHESDVHLAVSSDGAILTYKDPYAPVSAIDNHGNSQLNLIEAVDEDYYEGQPGDCVLLDFGSLDISNGAKLVFRANYEFKVKLKCIHVQILDATEGWVDVVAVRTRVHWSTQVVDLSGYLPGANGELTVRLCFTANHKIDYVGLDTTKQDDFDVHDANLVSATHSVEGDVKTELSASDDLYAELVPGEQIELAFTLPENAEDARTYIIHATGHYCTIS